MKHGSYACLMGAMTPFFGDGAYFFHLKWSVYMIGFTTNCGGVTGMANCGVVRRGGLSWKFNTFGKRAGTYNVLGILLRLVQS